MTSSHARIQVYPFVFVCIALFVLFLAHVQSSKNERLYLLEDIERDDSLITNELEGSEDDGNTFTGEQTNGNDDYEDNTLEETNSNSNNGIATDYEINSPWSLGDGHGISVDGQLDEENLSSSGISNSLGEFLCPPGKLMSPSMKCCLLYTSPSPRDRG